ncbi:MAG: hypothetical protein VZS44_08305 [Bacilli bacterium]|nr:hypothetical protein [Bacilli bacterium]
MSKKGIIKDTQLVCMCCGNVVMIQRNIRNLKKVGHIKHLYCYKCDSIQQHYEVRDVSSFIWKCSNKGINNLDDNAKLVFDFLIRSEDSYEDGICNIYKKILTKE